MVLNCCQEESRDVRNGGLTWALASAVTFSLSLYLELDSSLSLRSHSFARLPSGGLSPSPGPSVLLWVSTLEVIWGNSSLHGVERAGTFSSYTRIFQSSTRNILHCQVKNFHWHNNLIPHFFTVSCPPGSWYWYFRDKHVTAI